MASGRRGGLVRSIQAMYESGSLCGLDDADLLGRFLDRGEAAGTAFEAIMARHAAMVFGVCRSVAGSDADAEDAFQATFLILARRAASVRSRGSLGPWLFGVARRVALRAKAESARRRSHERRAAELSPTVVGPAEPDDAVAMLVEEIDRLPARYRDPIVLCHIQGLTYEAAARMLGCPIGTLGIRIRRAKQKLRTRLESRGLHPDPVPVAIPPGAVSTALVASTARLVHLVSSASWAAAPAPVLTLTQGALRSMRTTKLITASAAFVSVAAGAWSWQASASGDDPGPPVIRATALPSGEDPAPAGSYIVRGRVFADAMEPVAGVEVRFSTINPSGGGPIVRKVFTGADGTYSVALFRGQWDVLQPLPPAGWWCLKPPRSAISLSDPKPTVRLYLHASRGTPWEFRVEDAATGRPAPGLAISGTIGFQSDQASPSQTDAEGRARLTFVPNGAGSRVVVAGGDADVPETGCTLRWKSGFRPEAVRDVSKLEGPAVGYRLTDCDGRSAVLDQDRDALLEPRIEEGRLVVRLPAPNPANVSRTDVEGVVVDGAGRPVADARVDVAWVLSGARVLAAVDDRYRATTDDRGRYKIAGVPRADWGDRRPLIHLLVAKDGYADGDLGPIEVSGAPRQDAPAVALGPGCSAIGTVVGPDDRPIVGGVVIAYTDRGQHRREARTGADGRFAIDSLPEGKVRLLVRFAGMLNGGRPCEFTASSEPASLSIRLIDYGSLIRDPRSARGLSASAGRSAQDHRS